MTRADKMEDALKKCEKYWG